MRPLQSNSPATFRSFARRKFMAIWSRRTASPFLRLGILAPVPVRHQQVQEFPKVWAAEQQFLLAHELVDSVVAEGTCRREVDEVQMLRFLLRVQFGCKGEQVFSCGIG